MRHVEKELIDVLDVEPQRGLLENTGYISAGDALERSMRN